MLLFIALAGAGGAACRFLISTWIQTKLIKISLYATTIINIIGSFLLGICFGLHMLYPSDNHWYTIVATGFFGAFTTFSTFSYEAVLIYLKFPKKGVLFIVANICIATFFSSLAILIMT